MTKGPDKCKDIFSLIALSGEEKDPDLPQVQSLELQSSSSSGSAGTAKAVCGREQQGTQLCCASEAGWMGHVLLGTSSCLLQGRGMFLCVEMAQLSFPSPPLLPVSMAASCSCLPCSKEPAGGGGLGSLAPGQQG